MKKIFEEYVESADYKISVFFKELQAQIQKWFSEGSLAAQGCEIDGDIQISNYNPMEKFLICNFVEPVNEGDEEEGSSYRYRMIFMVRLDEMKGDAQAQGGQAQGMQAQPAPIETPTEGKSTEINKVLLKIHQFDEENQEKGELVEEVDVDDIKEDFIIDKIGQLKDKSDDKGVDKNDLKDNISTR
jgi:hypothetical protein